MGASVKIHNLTEDVTLERIEEICRELGSSASKSHICTCEQCKLDTACYVLNRMKPHYIAGGRGVARLEQERQQKIADIDALIHQGLEQVAHNRRPAFDHSRGSDGEKSAPRKSAVLNVPAIVGRVFNGSNFEPLDDVGVELRREGHLVPMRNANWQNPCVLVPELDGTYTFWPEFIEADSAGVRSLLDFSVTVSKEGFETVEHFFELEVTSENFLDAPFSMDRTYKLRDMFVFPAGEK